MGIIFPDRWDQKPAPSFHSGAEVFVSTSFYKSTTYRPVEDDVFMLSKIPPGTVIVDCRLQIEDVIQAGTATFALWLYDIRTGSWAQDPAGRLIKPFTHANPNVQTVNRMHKAESIAQHDRRDLPQDFDAVAGLLWTDSGVWQAKGAPEGIRCDVLLRPF